ncbi:hypothetical protein Tco_1170840, partial [Tanacetum coccineum]
YYADKSEKNKEKNFVHAISIIDFSKDDPFSSSTTNTPPPSFSLMKTSDNFEKFTDELAPLDSLPSGNNDSTFKKDLHENDKDTEIKSSSSFALTSPEESEFKAYLERDSIPPGIDLTLPPTLEVSSSNPTSLTLTGEKVCSWKTPMFFSLVRFVWKMMTQIAIRKRVVGEYYLEFSQKQGQSFQTRILSTIFEVSRVWMMCPVLLELLILCVKLVLGDPYPFIIID